MHFISLTEFKKVFLQNMRRFQFSYINSEKCNYTAKYRVISFCFLLCILTVLYSHAQDNAELKVHNTHCSKKATVYSAILPGLGQIYNKKYWKVPLIYTAFGTATYFFIENNNNYKKFKQAYIYRTDGNPLTVDDYTDMYTADNLKVLRDYYRKNAEISVIIGVGVYALNIIDAAVDAHLFNFEVNDDLSLILEPVFFPIFATANQYNGLRCIIKF